MRGISDNVSYLRGLVEGIQLSSSSKEGQVIVKILDVLDQMAQAFADMQDAHNELSDYLETLDNQVTEFQNSVDGEEIDDDEDFDEDDLDEDELEDEDEDMDEEDDSVDISEENVYLECVCPACKSVFYVGANELGEHVKHVCPACGEHVHVEAIEEENLPIAQLAPEDDDPQDDE